MDEILLHRDLPVMGVDYKSLIKAAFSFSVNKFLTLERTSLRPRFRVSSNKRWSSRCHVEIVFPAVPKRQLLLRCWKIGSLAEGVAPRKTRADTTYVELCCSFSGMCRLEGVFWIGVSHGLLGAGPEAIIKQPDMGEGKWLPTRGRVATAGGSG